ncbi:heme ABC transporter permease [Hwanghaeella grinnelliae]|uniref:Heme exporter protein C n=1 Tax=Hwanghaeella grinnelliae TaxID=2500179 RepID=A0A437QPX6_9PROT|nr:heme ABC transporter permease [Hwanghaeella grinnelliae]RVU36509.1 heme ABC transporter permease [Hwanghaeella grinnelliae]
MHRFANPTRFMKIANAVLPFAVGGFVILTGIGVYLGLFNSPSDYQQGDTVRIMYIHVPAAYLGVMIYGVIAGSSLSLLIWKHPLAELIARASAPVGLVFTFLCLVTGSLWGKPMWGTWWVWDARLTSMLILLFLYAGYIALSNAFDEPGRGNKPAAILALVGVVNLPIIKFSVDWWNTLHQPASIIRMDGPTIAMEMLTPLFYMLGGFTCFYLMILVIRLRSEIAASKLRIAMMSGAMASNPEADNQQSASEPGRREMEKVGG